MILSHKIQLQPNNKQITYFKQACGVSRFAYNWALAEWKKQYEAGEKPTWIKLNKQLNSVKRKEFPWMLDVSNSIPQYALINLGNAFNKLFQKQNKSPKFKKKGVYYKFQLNNFVCKINVNRIYIPKLGWVRMKESLRFSGKILSYSFSRVADKWFVSITVDTDAISTKCESQAEVGVDLGIKTLATFSDDRPSVEGPKTLKVLLPKLRKLSKSVSRKVKNSNNRKKAVLKLAKLHYRISCVRKDSLHKLTSMLTTNYGLIAIEDLNINGLLKNKKLARHISDASFGEFKRQLEYKSKKRDNHLVIIDRWFPSSKMCSNCSCINKKLKLSDRAWTCPYCLIKHDRDKNAAINILKAASSTVSACGETVQSGFSAKQEISAVCY